MLELTLPDFGRVADSCSRNERGQHHEEGDPGERNENVSRRAEVTHHVLRGVWGGASRLVRCRCPTLLECDGRHTLRIPVGFCKSGA